MKHFRISLRNTVKTVAVLAAIALSSSVMAQTRFNYTDASGVTCTYENPRIDNGVNSVDLYRVVSIPAGLTKWVMPETVIDGGSGTAYRLIQSAASCTFCDISVNTTLTEIVFPKYLRWDDSNPYADKFPNLHKLTFGEFASQFGGSQFDNLTHLDSVVFLGTDVIHSYGFQCSFMNAPANTKVIVPCGTRQQFVDAFNIDGDFSNTWTTANFIEAPCLNTITVLSSDVSKGHAYSFVDCGFVTTTPSNTSANHSGNITLLALPKGGVVFTGWNDGNLDNPRVVNVTADVTYTAQFATCTNTAIESVSAQAGGISIHPNPVEDALTVVADREIRNGILTLFDINGKLVARQDMRGSQAVINTQPLGKGVYILRLVEDGKASAGIKVAK